MRSNLVDVDVELVHQTDKAWLVHTGNKEQAVWVPKSQAELERGIVAGIYTLTLSESLAIDKGLV